MLFLHSVNKPWDNMTKIYSLKEIRQSHEIAQDRNRHLCCWTQTALSNKEVITENVAHLTVSYIWRTTSTLLPRDDNMLLFRSTSNSLFFSLPQPLLPPDMQVLWKRGITLISTFPLSCDIGQGESSVNQQQFLTEGCSISKSTFPFTLDSGELIYINPHRREHLNSRKLKQKNLTSWWSIILAQVPIFSGLSPENSDFLTFHVQSSSKLASRAAYSLRKKPKQIAWHAVNKISLLCGQPFWAMLHLPQAWLAVCFRRSWDKFPSDGRGEAGTYCNNMLFPVCGWAERYFPTKKGLQELRSSSSTSSSEEPLTTDRRKQHGSWRSTTCSDWASLPLKHQKEEIKPPTSPSTERSFLLWDLKGLNKKVNVVIYVMWMRVKVHNTTC